MTARRPDRRGQAAVEFALVLPLLVLMMVGIFDLGRGVYAWSTLNNAAREGARQGIVDQTIVQIRERAAQRAVALGIDPDDVVVEFRNVDDTGPCVQLTNGDTADDKFVADCLVRVRLTYPYQAATPVVGSIVGSFSLTGEATMPVETYCQEPVVPSCPRGD